MLTQIIQISGAQFWFEWGNEPTGYVSYGKYDDNGVFRFIGIGPRAWKNSLPFNCPFN